MHRFCTECEKHFIGKNKLDIVECKALGHRCIEVADEWDIDKPLVPISLKLNEYDETWHNKTGVLLARIIARGDLENYDEVVVYTCRLCNAMQNFNADNNREVPEAPKCNDCGIKMGRQEALCKVKLIRSLIIQEPFDEAQHMTPMLMEAIVTGDNAKNVYIGQDKILSGIFTAVRKKNTNRIVYDIREISDVSENKDILPTEEEVQNFKEMMKNDWIDKLTDSFAPEIYGLKREKQALILSLVSGSKIGDLRGDINTLLVGDPSTAKSRLLKYVLKITKKSAYALGRSSSAAGLVLGVDKLADGRNVIKAGPVVLCSGGVVCIDEIDKMADQDRSALHEAMEQQTATLNKIGSNLTMPAETVILAAANPKTSKYNVKLSISQNINMPDSLLSRFDLVFLVRDIAHRDMDLKKLRHISRVRQNKNDCEVLSVEEMTKLMNYCSKIEPKLNSEAMTKLENFFVNLRAYEQPGDSLAIDMRGFEGLIRLATANAKLRFCEEVDEQDVNEAIELYKYSLETFGMSTQGEFTASTIPIFTNKKEFVLETMKTISNANDVFNLPVLIKRMAEDGDKWFKSEVSAMTFVLDVLKAKEGLLIEAEGEDMYQYVH